MSYRDLQAKHCNLQPGDEVLMRTPARHDRKYEWPHSWNRNMERLAEQSEGGGETYHVATIEPTGIRLLEGQGFIYPFYVFTVVGKQSKCKIEIILD